MRTNLSLHSPPKDGNKKAVEQNASVNEKDEYGRTALHVASQNGQTEVVGRLVSDRASVHEKDKIGCTPLHWASQNGHKDIVTFLISSSADINEKDDDEYTALHQASENGHFEIVKHLVTKRADMDERDKWCGRTALHCASIMGHGNIVNLLVLYKADIDAKDKYEYTALHYASENGFSNIVNRLVSNNPNIDEIDKNGRTALHLASKMGNLDSVKCLVNKNANTEVKDKDGFTALHFAEETAIIEFLSPKIVYKEDEELNDSDNSLSVQKEQSISRDEVEVLINKLVDSVAFLKKQDPYKIFWNKTTDEIAPRYSLIIKRPMWLSLIEERVKNMEYQCEEHFNQDVLTIFQNCETYNGPDSPFSKYGRVIEERWRRRLGLLHFASSSLWCPSAVVVDAWNIVSTLDVRKLFSYYRTESFYSDLIEQPMDLTTIKQLIDTNQNGFQLVDLDANVQLMLGNFVILKLSDLKFGYVNYAVKIMSFWENIVAFYKAWAVGNQKAMVSVVAEDAKKEVMQLLDLKPLKNSGGDSAALLKKVLSLLVSLVGAIEEQHKLLSFLSIVKSLSKKVDDDQLEDLESFVEEVKSLEGSLPVYIGCALMTSVVAAKFPFLSRNKARTSETPRVRESTAAAAPQAVAANEQSTREQPDVDAKEESDFRVKTEQSPVGKTRKKRNHRDDSDDDEEYYSRIAREEKEEIKQKRSARIKQETRGNESVIHRRKLLEDE